MLQGGDVSTVVEHLDEILSPYSEMVETEIG
jgi:hypothetical protein